MKADDKSPGWGGKREGAGRKGKGLIRKTLGLRPEIWAKFDNSALILQAWLDEYFKSALPSVSSTVKPDVRMVRDDEIILTREQQTILDFMLSGRDIFVTGGAGVGKSILIREFSKAYKGSVILCAPTGVAAVNIGGATLHSVFRLPIKDIFLETDLKEIYDEVFSYDPKDKGQEKKWLNVLYGASCFIIDEISMCRGDTFSMIMACIHALRDKGRKVQVIVVGDFYQLPPVLTDKKSFTVKGTNEKLTQKEQYKTIYGNSSGYCFLTESWQFEICILNQIMRQADADFSEALNRVRIGDSAGLDYIFTHASKEPLDAVWICGTNKDAEARNNNELERLKGEVHTFRIKCELLDSREIDDKELWDIAYKTAKGDLVIKTGAAVVALVNAYDENGNVLYCNGSRGIVKRITEDEEVFVDFGNGAVKVAPYTWEEKRYVYDSKMKKADAKVVGNFRKVPLVLGYATTVHKSQGQTLDAINIDKRCNWLDGQLYVALSRAKRVDRIYIEGHPKPKVSQDVLDFYKGRIRDIEGKRQGKKAKK